MANKLPLLRGVRTVPRGKGDKYRVDEWLEGSNFKDDRKDQRAL